MKSTIVLYCLFLAQSFTVFAPPFEKICSTDLRIILIIQSIKHHKSNILFFTEMIQSTDLLLTLATINTAQKNSMNQSKQQYKALLEKEIEFKNNAEKELGLLYGKNNV